MARAQNPVRSSDAALRALRAAGLRYPGAHTKSPWPGHLDLAVDDKTFAYLSLEGEPLSVSCKLPRSSEVALMLPCCKPTAYGLGKSGWVTATFGDEPVPVDMLLDWLDESYRAQAPRRLVAQLDGRPPRAKPAAPRAKPAAPRTKPAVARAKPAAARAKPAAGAAARSPRRRAR